MIAAAFEQRNSYTGNPPRPWVRVRFTARDGATMELDLLADTGSPSAIILGRNTMTKLKRGDMPDVNTNFGLLEGGWLRIDMPALGLADFVLGYGNDEVEAAAKASSLTFAGLAGLPFLRLVEYGGDADEFWLRAAS